MESKQLFQIRLYQIAAVAVLLLIGVFASCTVHTNYRIAEAIKAGAEPMQAKCAFSTMVNHPPRHEGGRMSAKTKKLETTITVTVKCVGCGQRRDIKPGEVAPGEHPMCNTCLMPMVPVSAKGR